MGFQDVRPPDLEMRIRIAAEHGKTRLRFILRSLNGKVDLFDREVEGPLLQRSPEEYQGHLLSKIEKLGERLDVDRSPLLQSEIESKLASLGHDLWRELFSAELRAVYRDVIRPGVRSWVIVSDEPWIPWELVKPYSAGPGEPFDDDFLCLRFELTRWLAGGRPSAQQIDVRNLAVVASAPALPHASRERKLFDQLKEMFPSLEVAAPRLESASHVLELLASDRFGLIHFIGHGAPMVAHPDEAGLPFLDKSVFRPTDLHGPAAMSLGQNRPLVFLNACWAGKEGWSLTRLGGWAARWIGVCGCGAFVAPLWPVRDQMAVSFAWTFYEALGRGSTLGEAALAARQHVARERPGDPSGYAYTIYGHPNARVLFQAGSETDDVSGSDEIPPGTKRLWVPPSPRRRPRGLGWMGALLGFAGLLNLMAAPLTDLLFAIDPAWTVPGRTAGELQKEATARRLTSAPSSPNPGSTTTKVGGVQFKISGGQASLHYALKNALRKAATPLAEQGLSGWTINLELEPPRMSPVAQGSLTLQSCSLAAQASARGPTRLDLGPVNAVNAQFGGSKACEAATRSIAEAVISRFLNALSEER